MKKFFALFTSFSFLILNLSTPVFAQSAVIMSDDEMDQVYAGGLNLGFDSFLGNVPSTPANGAVSLPSKSSSISVDSNGILTFKKPTSPFAPSSVASVKTPDSVKPVDSVASVQAPNPVATVDSVASVQAPNPVATVDSVASVQAPNPVATVDSVASVQAPNPVATVDSVASVQAPNPVATVDSVASVQAPNPTTPPSPVVLDVFASSAKGNMQASLGENSLSAGTTPFSANSLSGLGSSNVVAVSDSSQAGLSSLVNVNAAGSTVQVQLNLTVIMNSTVTNLTNSNTLNSLTAFKLQ